MQLSLTEKLQSLIFLKKMNSRIQAVEQNQDALVKGIRVVDVPGGGIDLIINPQAVTTNPAVKTSTVK